MKFEINLEDDGRAGYLLPIEEMISDLIDFYSESTLTEKALMRRALEKFLKENE